MKRLLLTVGLILPLSPGALDDWQRAGCENLENTSYVTHWQWVPHDWYHLREIWKLQATGDVEEYSRQARVWRAMHPSQE